jgi:trans-2,3-dihydro-3-hydroxyanthranilate isomerase
MRKLEFYQLDVFTSERFSGNPLAVFPDGEGASDAEMQAIAKEMNLSETVFVLPSEKALKRLRIFTPTQELPLAGHPVVGTWNLLARLGVTPKLEDGRVTIEQELNLGVLEVDVDFRNSLPDLVTMTQGKFELSGLITDEAALKNLAGSLGLERAELAVSETMPVAIVSTGIRALDVPAVSLTALSRIRVDPNILSDIYLEFGAVGCYVFAFETIENRSAVHARFFAPADSIPEDPATGSAAGSLAGYLRYFGNIEQDEFVIEQGDFMGRPSRINATVSGIPGSVEKVRIGGRSVVVAKGEVYLD